MSTAAVYMCNIISRRMPAARLRHFFAEQAVLGGVVFCNEVRRAYRLSPRRLLSARICCCKGRCCEDILLRNITHALRLRFLPPLPDPGHSLLCELRAVFA